MGINDTSIPRSASILADNTTLEASGGKLQIKDNGVTSVKTNIVGIDNTTGKINPINSTNFEDLSGANLTGITSFMGGILDDSIAFGVTRYICPFGWNDVEVTDENFAYVVVPQAVTISKFYVNLYANTLNNNCIITLRKNFADTTITTTYSTGQTGAKNDTAHSVSFSAGDKLSIKIDTTASGSGTCNNLNWGFI